MKFLIVLSFFISSSVFAAAKINVNAYTVVKNKKNVYLGDVLLITGVSAQTSKKIKSIKLSDAPSKGERRVFSNNAISQLLRKHVRGQRISLKIPRHIIIENPVDTISKDNVKSKFLKLIKKYCGECVAEITNINLPKVPQHLRASEWNLADLNDIPRGSFSHLLQLSDKGDLKNYWVTGSIRIKKNVPVLNKTIFIGQTVNKSDFSYKLKDVTFLKKGVPKAEEIVGRSLRRSLRAEEIIWNDAIGKRNAFRRGDYINIVSKKNSWEMSMRGIAQQDGYIGEFARVLNPKTKKIISAKVTDKNQVEL